MGNIFILWPNLLIILFLYSIDDSPQWGELDGKGKAIRVVTIFLKIVGVFAALYFFICSIGLMSSAFQCLGKHFLIFCIRLY